MNISQENTLFDYFHLDFIDEVKFLVLSGKDSLPILKAIVREAFKHFGIDVKYYKDLIKFKKNHIIIILKNKFKQHFIRIYNS